MVYHQNKNNYEITGICCANIISFNEKRIDKKEKTDQQNKQLKILAVQKIFQCIRCAFKCEKCGAQIELDPKPEDSKQIPFTSPIISAKAAEKNMSPMSCFKKQKRSQGLLAKRPVGEALGKMD